MKLSHFFRHFIALKPFASCFLIGPAAITVLLQIFAGMDTISNALCQLTEYLVEYLELQERLYTELKADFADEITYEKLVQHAYLDAFFSESLRLGTALFSLMKNAAVVSKI